MTPRERKTPPSGSTSHHRPFRDSTRKKPASFLISGAVFPPKASAVGSSGRDGRSASVMVGLALNGRSGFSAAATSWLTVRGVTHPRPSARSWGVTVPSIPDKTPHPTPAMAHHCHAGLRVNSGGHGLEAWNTCQFHGPRVCELWIGRLPGALLINAPRGFSRSRPAWEAEVRGRLIVS